ncbi:hypothetical protein AXE80_05985 [Wenyingzhuangia fucanilytica]|uniref:TonB-dependent receptor plug domain-containing protein n=2 Tax=Wenyingzhuangia fucanilytica TaxID=1790137 RepID=A0A1B1Y503_9FLAO|nr:hypothetical protein AXE80_05985 [Wenyingzhuangia fucanilytica]
MILFCITVSNAQTVSGKVTADGLPVPGATILVKGTTIGVFTDFDGNYSIKADTKSTLVFSYMGYETQEVLVSSRNQINVTLKQEGQELDEVVVVGYGTQKKESVVGAITQIKGEELMERTSGVANVEEALQGNLPGVTAIQGSGIPGQSDVQIFIRGQSTWNNSGQPLILVDGVKRSMSDVDMNEIEGISVLKDASATAVFGVEGANGVILITTKRGKTGKAQLSLSVNTTYKTVSKLPNKLDAYDAVLEANKSIMREVMYSPDSWDDYRPMGIVNKYRNPLTEEESYIYPNINWEDEILKDFAQDTRVNLSVRGGSKGAKYFGSLSYQTVNDIFDGSKYDSGKGYLGEYKYDRFNYRTNIDFDITKSTEFSVNLSGYLGTQETPSNLNTVVNGIYEIAPNLYTPVYPDGLYGQFVNDVFGITNPIVSLTNTGYNTSRRFQVNSDFILKQKLDFVTKGLSFKGRFSLDNNMTSNQSLTDNGADGLENVVYRVYDGDKELILSPNGVNDFDFVVFPWTLDPSTINDGTRSRQMVYDFSLNYNRKFAKKHDVSALFLFRRQQYAIGNQFPTFREDWVGRVTYNYDSRYFLDVNGAYNGSERFGPGYRFDLFPSVAAGWMMSNESFIKKNVNWINKLKFRGSYGLVGDDKLPGRWNYLGQWASGGSTFLNPNKYHNGRSPYTFYKEDVVGNPDLQWETAIKYNFGAELSLFNNMITAEFDYFGENRDNILIRGSQRSVPEFYGNTPPDFNGGKVEVRGFELVIGGKYKFSNGIDIWGNYSFTQAKDVVLERDDPEFRPFYQKNEGYPIGQNRSAIPTNILTSWDDIYMSTPQISGQEYRRPGYYDVVDFDGDGTYNSAYDNAPFGQPIRPQRNWNVNLGAGYKGFNIMAQFYGTQNSLRRFGDRTFTNQTDLIFEQDIDYWTKENPGNTDTMPTWKFSQAATNPRNNYYDSSVVRFKTLQLSYDIPKTICEKLGVSSFKVFANGNNLYLWSDLPDDREFNGNITADSDFRGDYPTLKRFNFGFNMNF